MDGGFHGWRVGGSRGDEIRDGGWQLSGKHRLDGGMGLDQELGRNGGVGLCKMLPEGNMVVGGDVARYLRGAELQEMRGDKRLVKKNNRKKK